MNRVLVLTFMAMLALVVFISIETVRADSTMLYVDPQFTVVGSTSPFQINISISNVTDLAAWDFSLYYPSGMLNATQILEGPFLKGAGSTSFSVFNFTDNYNATHGRIWVACTLIGQGSGASGNGVLATITFKAMSGGTSTLHLGETELLDSEMPPNEISHATRDGSVETQGHDMAVTDVTPVKTIVGRGFACRVNVTVQNKGTFTDISNVTLYANVTAVSTIQNVVVPNSTSTTVTLTWNTSGYSYGNYSISAYVWVLPGEINTGDNTLSDGRVLLTIPGDVDGNFRVDMGDIIMILKRFGSIIGRPNYDPICDLDDNLKIDMGDVVAALVHFGQHYP